MARSVADKFSKREDVLFPLKYFYGNFGEIPPFTDDTTGNRMSWKEGEKTGILFIEFRGCEPLFWGWGWRKNYIFKIISTRHCDQAAYYASQIGVTFSRMYGVD